MKNKKKRKEIWSPPTCSPDNEEPDDVVNAAEKKLSLKSDCFMHKISTGMRAAILQDRRYLKLGENIKQWGYVIVADVLLLSGKNIFVSCTQRRLQTYPKFLRSKSKSRKLRGKVEFSTKPLSVEYYRD